MTTVDNTLRIFDIELNGAVLGLCRLPGRFGNMEDDCDVISQWSPDVVVSFVQASEFDEGHFQVFAKHLGEIKTCFVHMPIDDFAAGAPNDPRWLDVQMQVDPVVQSQGRVLFHCYGGCGRSGMGVLRTLVDAGRDPAFALAQLRTIRPCAIETAEQLAWATHDRLNWDEVRG